MKDVAFRDTPQDRDTSRQGLTAQRDSLQGFSLQYEEL
jgi:hypothetical protein